MPRPRHQSDFINGLLDIDVVIDSRQQLAAATRQLATLGYDASAAEKIVTHLRAENTIEGAPGLSNEHLPVFDCAFQPTGGVR